MKLIATIFILLNTFIFFGQQVPCSICKGTGQETKSSPYTCQNCKSWNAEYRRKVACNVCKDTRVNPNRKSWKETCHYCKGTGRDSQQESRNQEFGNQEYRILNSVYSGTISSYNIQFRSLELEYRQMGSNGSSIFDGIKNSWTWPESSTACSCLGNEWQLPTKVELAQISDYVKINGMRSSKGNMYYLTSTKNPNFSGSNWKYNLSNGITDSGSNGTEKEWGIICVKKVTNSMQSGNTTSQSQVKYTNSNNSSSYRGYVGQPSGCVSGNCVNGFGTYNWSSGNVYKGQFLNGAKQMGEFFFINGDYYNGQFTNDKLTGSGKYVFVSGEVQEGYFENGVLMPKQSNSTTNSTNYQQQNNSTTNTSLRDPQRKDIANVYWNGNYPLYSLKDDVEILPDNNGVYRMWYASNEDKTPRELIMTKGQVKSFYKFKTYEECLKWCRGL